MYQRGQLLGFLAQAAHWFLAQVDNEYAGFSYNDFLSEVKEASGAKKLGPEEFRDKFCSSHRPRAIVSRVDRHLPPTMAAETMKVLSFSPRHIPPPLPRSKNSSCRKSSPVFG
jgi:hypothetical protein